MKRLGITLTILALLVVGLGHPTLARNNVEHETWNMEHMAGANVWTQCSQGMWGGYVHVLALSPSYATDGTLFAGTYYGGIFKSTDAGISWSVMGLTDMSIRDLALSPGYASDHTLFAGAGGGGVFKSTNGGASWNAVNTGISGLYVSALALSPGYATDQTLFAGTGSYSGGSGVFKSTDGGGSWNAVNTGLTNMPVYALAISPGYASDHTLFAGIWGGGVFKSTDGGASWSAVNTGLTGLWVRAVALSPGYASDHTLFAGPGGGVFKSTDGGASWNAVNNGITAWDVEALALSPGYATDHTIFAGTGYGHGIFKSTDGGTSWSAVNNGITPWTVEALALSPGYVTDRTVFAGVDYGWGVFKSTDGGAFWSAANTGLTGQYVQALVLSPGYVSDHTIFAGTMGGGVFKSTNGGASWNAVNTGITHRFLYAYALAISPGYATDRTIFVGTGENSAYTGVFKSTDGGASWNAVNTGLTSLVIDALAISPGYASDHTIFAGTWDGGVFKSTDGGASWSAVNTGLTSLYVRALALSPGYATDQTIFAGTGDGIYKSTDGGASWSATGFTGALLALSPGYATDHTLFAVASGGVFKSTDGGASWSATGLTTGARLALSPDYVTDHTLFAVSEYNRVFESTDGGASWSAMNSGLGNLDIRCLALTPTSPRILFAGTGGSSMWQYTIVTPTVVYLPLIMKNWLIWVPDTPTPRPTLTSTPTPNLKSLVTEVTLTLPQPLAATSGNWCTWGGCSMSPRLYHEPLSDGRTLVGWTDSSGNGHVSVIDNSGSLDQTYDFPALSVRGMVAHDDGKFAILLWNSASKIMWLSKRNANGGEIWTTNIKVSLPDITTSFDPGIGDSRLTYGNGLYAAYFAVHGDAGWPQGHNGDQLTYVDSNGAIQPGGWNWGCSHSMAELVNYHPTLNKFVPACSSDCYASKGILLNDNQVVYQCDGNCGGLVSAQLGQIALSGNSWKIIFNALNRPGYVGKGIGLATIDGSFQSSYVWLTNTNGDYERDPVMARLGSSLQSDRYVVGWQTTNDGVYWLGVVNGSGSFLTGPEEVSSAGIAWGNRDDSFRTRADGSVSWVQGNPTSTTLRMFRFNGSTYIP